MHISFNGRRVVIAGGSRGIGRSIALGFAAAGADVSICARGPDKLRQTAEELRKLGARVHESVCDLSDGPAVLDYVEAAADTLGGIDVLVNNASGFGRSDDEEGWAASIDVDLMATVRASRAALPHLERSRGSIVHVSSISGLAPSVRTPPYGAIKAALIQYTMTQAAALAGAEIGHDDIEVGDGAQHGTAPLGIGLPGAGEPHALGGPIEQDHAEPAFQVGHAPADGGGGNALPLGSAADGAGFGQKEDEPRRNAIEWCHMGFLTGHHTHRRRIGNR